MTNAVEYTADPKEQGKKLRELLRQYGETNYSPDLGVAYHTTPRNKVSLPEGMSPATGAKILTKTQAALDEVSTFTKTFRYRPNDGAVAVQRVMMKFFGTGALGKSVQTMFGSIPPQLKEIEVGYDDVTRSPITTQVAWGLIDFAHLDGELYLTETKDDELGMLFQIIVKCPKLYDGEVHGFFNLIEDELRKNSIYKGKAIRGVEDVHFLPTQVDSSIVYNQDVYDKLDATCWGIIREEELMRSLQVKTDPRILLYGPYGTGKSEAGRSTARVATDNGWTFVLFKSNEGTIEDLEATLVTARLLAPAVVFVEDIDTYMSNNDEHHLKRLLEIFDGISSKGQEVMIMMTTNQVDALHSAMTRSGRIDHMIEIGNLDAEATERLIRTVSKDVLGEVDFQKVWEALGDIPPAFVRAIFDDARQAAAIRTARWLRANGTFTVEAARNFELNTEDFVTAALLKRPHIDRHGSGPVVRPPSDLHESFSMLVREEVAKVVGVTDLLNRDDDLVGRLSSKA